MEASTRWPANVCGGADFVDSRHWEIRDGEQIIDLQVSLDDLPIQSGWQLAIHQNTVLNMMRALRWPTPDVYDDLAAQLAFAQADAELLRQALVEAQRDKAEAEQALAAITRVQRAKAGVTT